MSHLPPHTHRRLETTGPLALVSGAVLGPNDAAEIARLRAVLAASCDDERSQIWEAGLGGGCGRALDAESERDKLRAALTACQEDAARMRIWGGMGWVWHSHYAATIHERCERALGPNARLKGARDGANESSRR